MRVSLGSLWKGYNYDCKKMLGLVLCYFNNQQSTIFSSFSLSKLMFFSVEQRAKAERSDVILLLEIWQQQK